MGAIATNRCDASVTTGAMRECTIAEETVAESSRGPERHERSDQGDGYEQSAYQSEGGAEEAIEKRQADGVEEAIHDPSEDAAAEQNAEYHEEKTDQIRDPLRTHVMKHE